MVRFEVVEEASPGADGERLAHVPGRGVFRSAISANGDLMVGEDQLRTLLGATADPTALRHGVQKLLGRDWDDDLEPYRQAGDGAPVTWLHSVG